MLNNDKYIYIEISYSTEGATCCCKTGWKLVFRVKKFLNPFRLHLPWVFLLAKWVHLRGVITTKATKAAALVDFWDCNILKEMAQTASQIWRKKNLYFSTKQKLLKYTVSFLQNWKNKCYSPKQKMFFHILSLHFRIDEINIFIILPSIKKTPLIYSLCFEELKKMALLFY